ncbi:MAG: hypothetical protein IT582_10410 [Opitutaceae bacterium]|nr:hypothetical protein [Opitutaceae bacterium]
MMRKIQSALPLLIVLFSVCWLGGCNTAPATSQSASPTIEVSPSDLRAMWGGRIGEALAPTSAMADNSEGAPAERTDSINRQYQSWSRSQRS